MAGQHTIDMGSSMETEEGLAIIDSLNEVSDVLAMAGSEVTFVAEEPVHLGGYERLRDIDFYRCPRGAFLLFMESEGPHWATAGETAEAALDAIHEDGIREHVRQQLTDQRLF